MNLSSKSYVILIKIVRILVFAAAIVIATKLTLEFGMLSRPSTAAFCFLIIVLLSAFFGDLFTAIITSILATLIFDFFYLPPFGTFYIAEFSDWISLAAFLLASVIISYLAASAEENKVEANLLNKTLVQIKEFGERLMSVPQNKFTLTGIAKEVLDIFSLEYCSIHVYGKGKWQHFIGAASIDVPQEIKNKVKYFQDHPMDILEIVNESTLGVTFARINKEKSTLALLVVKSNALPNDAIGAIAYMIGVRLDTILMKDGTTKIRKPAISIAKHR